MTINRIWGRFNLLAAAIMAVTLIYGVATKNTDPLRIGLVIWALSYLLRLMNNKCKKCGQSFSSRQWKQAGPEHQICPRCGTRHHII